MAHHLANNPGQPDAGEILLSGISHMALQMEAQRRLMKPGSKPRRGKKCPKKQPQRGLGVAQLEKIRLEEQRRVSQHTQQLAALRQLQTVPPPLFNPSAVLRASATIIPQIERESNNHASSLMLHTPMSSSLSQFPCMDTMVSSFLSNNVSPALSSTTVRASVHATPLDLFPAEKLGATTAATTSSLIKASHGMLTEKSRFVQHVENKDCVENSQSLLNLPYDRSNEGHDHGNMSYSLLHMQRNCLPIAESRNSAPLSTQVPNRMTSTPSFNRDSMMELSSFQSAAVPSRGEELVFPKRRAWGTGLAARPSGCVYSEQPIWPAVPSLAHCKTSQEQEVYWRNEEECELTLWPPGADNRKSVKEERPNEAPACGRGPHNFLSLWVGATWEESVADASSSAPSPVSATTKTTTTSTTSTTDDYTSPSSTSVPCATNFFSTKGYLSTHWQSNLCDINLDLTLKL